MRLPYSILLGAISESAATICCIVVLTFGLTLAGVAAWMISREVATVYQQRRAFKVRFTLRELFTGITSFAIVIGIYRKPGPLWLIAPLICLLIACVLKLRQVVDRRRHI
jgi:hypothetical protein